MASISYRGELCQLVDDLMYLVPNQEQLQLSAREDLKSLPISSPLPLLDDKSRYQVDNHHERYLMKEWRVKDNNNNNTNRLDGVVLECS